MDKLKEMQNVTLIAVTNLVHGDIDQPIRDCADYLLPVIKGVPLRRDVRKNKNRKPNAQHDAQTTKLLREKLAYSGMDEVTEMLPDV